jgi:hypothetical protein
MPNDYTLDTAIMKTDEDLELCRSEKVLVETHKGTLAVAVMKQSKKEGHIFIGHGKLVVDTIVETERGAFGRPVQRDITEPFLMLGNVGEPAKHLVTANNEDLKKMNMDEKRFLDEAQGLLAELGRTTTALGFGDFGDGKGSTFVFRRGQNKPDTLVVNSSKFVYAAQDLTFVSSRGKSVLKRGGHVVLSSPRRIALIGLDQSIDRCSMRCHNKE